MKSIRTRSSMADARGRAANADLRFEAEAPQRRRGLAPDPEELEGALSPEALRMAEALLAVILRLDHSLQVIVHFMTESETYDVSADKQIGHDPSHAIFLRLRLTQLAEEGGSIVIRQLTDKKEMSPAANGEMMLMPWKNVYGAFIQGAQMSTEGIPAVFTFSKADLLDSYSVDAVTGEPIQPEPLLNFCGFSSILTDEDRAAIRVEAMPSEHPADED